MTFAGWLCLALGGLLNVGAFIYYLSVRGAVRQPQNQRAAALGNGVGSVLVLVGLLLLTNA